jgi:AI-2 transport protein TqsA
MISLKNTAYFLVSAIALVFILITGRGLLIPFVFAILLWFVVREIRQAMNKVPIINKWLPLWIKNTIAFVFILLVLNLVLRMFLGNVTELTKSYALYEKNLLMLISLLDNYFQINVMTILKEQLSSMNIGSIAVEAIKQSTDFVSNIFMILLYAMFVFLEETSFKSKIQSLYYGDKQTNQMVHIINNIDRSVSKYLGVKLLTSAITGVASYLVLRIIDIDFPFFWAFMIFTLNFIPTIGSIVATLFPALFAILQYGEWFPALMVLVFVGSIQVLVGNVLEPNIMGHSMNISPLVTIMALSFWGAIWGITGMILSVPMMVIIIIVLAQFPSTRTYAILLSAKGEV